MKHINCIHEHPDWNGWQWSNKKLLPLVSRVRILQGHLLGWHRAIFPDRYSGLYHIKAGNIGDAVSLCQIWA